MNWWRRLHTDVRPLPRAAIKLAFVLVALVLIMYPDPRLLLRTVARELDREQLLTPDEPLLAPLEIDLRNRLAFRKLQQPDEPPGAALLGEVEATVYEHLPYAFDWDTWGVMHYVPTVREALERGREDCDGRAVVAAALLRRIGHEATIVTDLQHAWIRTPAGDALSPGAGRALEEEIPPTLAGYLGYSRDLAANAGRALGYGIAVFPLVRILLIWTVTCAALLHPRCGRGRSAVGLGLTLFGLAWLHDAGPNAYGHGGSAWAAWVGLGLLASGVLALVVKAGAPLPRASAAE